MTRRMAVALLAFLVLPAACGDDTSTTTVPAPETTVLQPPSDSSSPVPSTEPGEGSVPTAYVDAVIADAAGHAAVAEDEVDVVEARAVEWPDGSLGCPEPGMLYTQVLTPGYQVIVTAGDETLDYRLDRRGSFRICENDGLGARDPDMTLPSAPGEPDR